jgi:hypothetical protein
MLPVLWNINMERINNFVGVKIDQSADQGHRNQVRVRNDARVSTMQVLLEGTYFDIKY